MIILNEEKGMKQFFINNELKDQFEKDGYLLIDLFSEEEIHQLKEIYNQYSYNFQEYFYSSSFIPQDHIRAEISERLKAIISPKAETILQNFKKLGAVFLIKPPHPNSVMPIHQDWTVVEEKKYHSITFWIPLQDTTVENGAIKVLPTSHKLCDALRSPALIDPIDGVRHLAEPLMQTLEMKAGQAFIFTHALWHSSFSNLSQNPRIAVAYGVIPEEAELVYYHKENGVIQQLSILDDFFIAYPNPGEIPQNSGFIKNMDYQEKVVSEVEFRRHFGLISPQKSFLGKLGKLILFKKHNK